MRLFAIALFLVFFVLSVSAADIRVVVTKEQNFGEPGGVMLLSIAIANEQIRDDTFELKVGDFAVAPFSDAIESVVFLPSATVTVPSHQQKTVRAKVKFLNTARPSRNYVIPLEVKSLNNPNVKEVLNPLIYVVSPKDVVNIEVLPNLVIVPGEETDITLRLKNTVNVELEDARIFYTSTVFNFEDIVTLKPLEEKNVILPVLVDSITPNGDYSMNVRIFKDDILKGSDTFAFSVRENPDLAGKDSYNSFFLRSSVTITRENTGNVEVKKTIKHPVTFLKSIFTRTNPKGTMVVNEEGRHYEWSFTVLPGQTYRIEVITDYTWFFLAIVVILMALVVYIYVKNKELKLVKEVFKLHTRDKGSSELKVLLHIINKGSREIYAAKVMDFLPRHGPAEIDYGTLRPNKVDETGGGKRLLWELPKIEPGEERIISYIVKSKVTSTMDYKLPSAQLRFYGKRKRVIYVKSNKPGF